MSKFVATNKKTASKLKKQFTLKNFRILLTKRTMLSVTIIAALIVGFATYAMVQSARAGTDTIRAEIDSGSVSGPAKAVKNVSSASGGGVIAFSKKKAAPKVVVKKPTTTKKTTKDTKDDEEDEDSGDDEDDKKSSSSSSDASACKPGLKLKDQDPEDEQHPWKRPSGKKVVINFITKGLNAEQKKWVDEAVTVWNKSPCLDTRAVDSCPSGGNCVSIKYNDGGGDDGNYDEKLSGKFQTGTGSAQIKKSMSKNEQRNVTIHELGHSIGLAHVKTKKDMMNEDTYDDVFTASKLDYDNLLALYGNQK